uniref:Uncharacterized protein n=1 Tax=Oryza sativa subsp. japonica TaxID=39947 RepID=Q5Z435_ORYSJ|nr:hypothetical protein [Oryza sativa Japonica Group]
MASGNEIDMEILMKTCTRTRQGVVLKPGSLYKPVFDDKTAPTIAGQTVPYLGQIVPPVAGLTASLTTGQTGPLAGQTGLSIAGQTGTLGPLPEFCPMTKSTDLNCYLPHVKKVKKVWVRKEAKAPEVVAIKEDSQDVHVPIMQAKEIEADTVIVKSGGLTEAFGRSDCQPVAGLTDPPGRITDQGWSDRHCMAGITGGDRWSDRLYMAV